MSRLFYWLGDTSVPYRQIMAEHKDFEIDGICIPKTRCVIAEQTHSSNVHVCTEQDGGAGWDDKPQIMDTDALVTDVPELFLISRTADCTPILMHDEQNQAVAAIHSGREGTRRNIAGKTVQTMITAYHSNPAQLIVWIGPGICEKHYEVNETIWTEFIGTIRRNNVVTSKLTFRRIDIQNVIIQQLILAGVKLDNIVPNSICTLESDLHFSFRRDGSHNRQINIIGLRYGKHH